MTLGLSRVVRSIPGLLSSSDFEFYPALVFTIIGGNLFYSGFNHLTVRTRNPTSMRYTAIALLTLYALILLYVYYIGGDVIYTFLSDINMVGYIPLYIGLLALLYSREITENNPIGRIASFMHSLSANTYVGDNITISEEDAKGIEEGFSDCASWTETDVNGITVKERCVVFHTHNGDKDVIIQRWPDNEGLYLSLINDRIDSFIGGQRIRAIGYELSDGMIVLTDDRGACVFMTIGGGC